MNVVIIAGGSGTRLWPLSTHNYPKHLLCLLNERSLLQNTVARVKQLTTTDKIFVISERSHVGQVREQLKGEVDETHVYDEPARRGTASCLALALADIDKRKLDKDEPLFVLWADHAIQDVDGFAAAMVRAADVAAKEKKIVFIGATPTYAATKYGYIKKGEELDGWPDIYHHQGFIEKPNITVAQEYFTTGHYLWNMGYLMATPNVLLKAMERYSPDMLARYKALQGIKDIERTYLGLENIALEYVFSEKIQDALVIQGAFDWVDIGSFEDLHELSLQDEQGNHVYKDAATLELATNSYVRNELDLPVAVIGLDNVVVVTTKDGILVTNKNFAQKVGDVAKRLQQP